MKIRLSNTKKEYCEGRSEGTRKSLKVVFYQKKRENKALTFQAKALDRSKMLHF